MLDPLGPHLWPLLFGHCLLSSCLLFCQAELQWSRSQHDTDRRAEGCQLLRSCRTYPPLPPPPPPPPPPRGPACLAPDAPAPPPRPWWMEMVVIGTAGAAFTAFLLLAAVICYKAMKRKPLKKEKNGVSCGGDAMSSVKKSSSAAV